VWMTAPRHVDEKTGAPAQWPDAHGGLSLSWANLECWPRRRELRSVDMPSNRRCRPRNEVLNRPRGVLGCLAATGRTGVCGRGGGGI
jgi:hypothetical protein